MVMISREDLESFLIRMDTEWEEVEEGMFLLRSNNGGPVVVVHHSDPVLLLRLKVMDLPDGGEKTDLYRTLLELNATDIVHGAYGIEEGELIISDTLELSTLDFEELQASVESLQYAVASHMHRIRELAGVDSRESDDGGEG
jgi:CesT_Tir_1